MEIESDPIFRLGAAAALRRGRRNFSISGKIRLLLFGKIAFGRDGAATKSSEHQQQRIWQRQPSPITAVTARAAAAGKTGIVPALP